MKTIQTLGWYFPDSTGGSEVYVAGLVKALRARGVTSVVAAPREGSSEGVETIDGTSVYRYPVMAGKTVYQHAGMVPHNGFANFMQWLPRQQATIYHQHSLTYGCSVHHLQAARDAGMTTLLTLHTPGPVCLRDTLLYAGISVCDGRIDVTRCASCWLQSRGLPAAAATALALIPTAWGRSLRPVAKAGPALAATAMAQDHLATLRRACALAERVVVVCQWLHAALCRNGIPEHKLVLSRQGITQAGTTLSPRKRANGAPLVVGFLGRGDPVKGVAVLVHALQALKTDTPLQLKLHVVESNEPHARAYLALARQQAARDVRITFAPALAPQAVSDFLAGIDLLAVPSQWLETGPLVVLEAFAAGVPVLGSDLGGISELVRNRHNGLLVKHDDVAAWAAALRECCSDPSLLPRLRANIGPVRTMADVAGDMQRLYTELTA